MTVHLGKSLPTNAEEARAVVGAVEPLSTMHPQHRAVMSARIVQAARDVIDHHVESDRYAEQLEERLRNEIAEARALGMTEREAQELVSRA